MKNIPLVRWLKIVRVHEGVRGLEPGYDPWTYTATLHYIYIYIYHIMMMMMMIMIFIYWNWVSTRWQWSVDLYRNRKETALKEKQYTKQHKNTEYTK